MARSYRLIIGSIATASLAFLGAHVANAGVPGDPLPDPPEGVPAIGAAWGVKTTTVPADSQNVLPSEVSFDVNDQSLWSEATGVITVSPDGSDFQTSDEFSMDQGYGYTYQVRPVRARLMHEPNVRDGERLLSWKYEYEVRHQQVTGAKADGGVEVPIIADWSDWEGMSQELGDRLARYIALPMP
ncbi:hypothetical protein ACUY2L_10325 [Corynebacterium mastitidis]